MRERERQREKQKAKDSVSTSFHTITAETPMSRAANKNTNQDPSALLPLLLGHSHSYPRPPRLPVVEAWDPANTAAGAGGRVSGTGAGGMGIKPGTWLAKPKKTVHRVGRLNAWSGIEQITK